MFNTKIFILLLVTLPAVFCKTDYCSAKLCKVGEKHVGCKNEGNFAKICTKPEIIKITPEIQDQIVDKHNTLRNKVAKGFDKFPSAARMATMQWNDELAKLAELNVKQCKMEHDECHNTENFAYAGQNIASSSWKGMEKTVEDVIDRQIDNWFNEYKDCPVDVIKSYKETNGKAIGHFTAMIQQKSTHIGCAILRQDNNGAIQQIMTCNYAVTNIKETAVYREGKPTSRCETGPNKNYKFLCSTEEKYK